MVLSCVFCTALLLLSNGVIAGPVVVGESQQVLQSWGSSPTPRKLQGRFLHITGEFESIFFHESWFSGLAPPYRSITLN